MHAESTLDLSYHCIFPGGFFVCAPPPRLFALSALYAAMALSRSECALVVVPAVGSLAAAEPPPPQPSRFSRSFRFHNMSSCALPILTYDFPLNPSTCSSNKTVNSSKKVSLAMFTYVDVLAKPCPPYLARIGCNTGAMHASTSLAVSARCPCADARSARINRGFAPPLDDHFFVFVVVVVVVVFVFVVFPRADEDVPAPLSRLFASARAARAASNVRAVCSAFSGRPRPRAYFLSNLPMTRDDDETDTENTHGEHTRRTHTEARNACIHESMTCMNPCVRESVNVRAFVPHSHSRVSR